jgi:hypothetical protein
MKIAQQRALDGGEGDRPGQGVRGLLFLHIPNGGARTAAEASILKGLGVMRGAPDLLLIHRGVVFALELKAPSGRLS